jgi:hypothetical protein
MDDVTVTCRRGLMDDGDKNKLYCRFGNFIDVPRRIQLDEHVSRLEARHAFRFCIFVINYDYHIDSYEIHVLYSYEISSFQIKTLNCQNR